jgi:general stress protein YciG
LEANLVEDRLIKPFYNTDKWCLNEGYGGRVSYECSVKGGITCKENKVGIFALTKEQRSEIGKMSGNKAKELGIGVHSLTKEELSTAGKKGGSISGKIAGNICKEKKLGICGRSKEKMSEDGRKAGKIGGKSACKITNAQKWKCLETGFITTSGPLTHYQKARNIDTSKRVKLS